MDRQERNSHKINKASEKLFQKCPPPGKQVGSNNISLGGERMKTCWWLALLGVALVAVSAAAEEPADTPAANVVPTEEKTLLPLGSFSLLPAPQSQAGRGVDWESLALFAPRAEFGRSTSAAGAAAVGADQSPTTADNDKWSFVFAPYLLFGSIGADIGVGRVTSASLPRTNWGEGNGRESNHLRPGQDCRTRSVNPRTTGVQESPFSSKKTIS